MLDHRPDLGAQGPRRRPRARPGDARRAGVRRHCRRGSRHPDLHARRRPRSPGEGPAAVRGHGSQHLPCRPRRRRPGGQGVQQPAPRGADDRYRRSHGPGRGQRPRGEGAGRDHAPQLRWQLGAGSLQPLAGGYGERSGVARLQRRLHGPVDGQGPRAGPGSRPGQRQQHADGQPGAEPVPSAAEAGLCGAGLFRGAEIVRSDTRPIDRQAGPRPGWSIRRCEEPALNALLLRYRFRLLFFTTVLFTAILGLPSSTKPRVLGSLLLLVLAGMNTLRRRSPLVYLTAFFGLFSLALYTTADFSSPYSSLPPGLLRGLSLILLYLTLFAALFRRVTQERPVTHELLYGLCALYLQMALAFALAYYMVEQMQPASFIASHGALGLDTFVYYSLVTLTTVGYGDIQAINPLARLLAGSEGVIGVLFIALAVARSLTLMSDSEEV
ncbi:hypothetical protein PAMH19_4043 [Pseudomonas aeruginosa]|nr:hypothetical protein PAMH19_4043 [Pseudomonas aeruginosa]